MSALPPTMRAWTYNSRGTPRSVLTLDNAFPTPPPPAGSDLLIRISHASVNPGTLVVLPLGVTLLLRRGSVPACIPELDFAGTVSLAGPAAPEKFKEGTRVFGSITPQSWEYLRRGAGTLAEFVLVQADAVAMMPDGLGMEEAGGLSGSGQTALKMCKVAGIKPLTRPRVLVNGGSGGVGTMVCQLARAMGASAVVATCSGGNVEMVEGLGVDEVSSHYKVCVLCTHKRADP
jgi:NADPH:quinone reductase-like Zn-dependent oxidoreductase